MSVGVYGGLSSTGAGSEVPSGILREFRRLLESSNNILGVAAYVNQYEHENWHHDLARMAGKKYGLEFFEYLNNPESNEINLGDGKSGLEIKTFSDLNRKPRRTPSRVGENSVDRVLNEGGRISSGSSGLMHQMCRKYEGRFVRPDWYNPPASQD